MRTPSDLEEDEADERERYPILTPVPKTPAPEAVARMAAAMAESPSGSDGAWDEEWEASPTQNVLVTRTCPPASRKQPAHILDTDAKEEEEEQQEDAAEAERGETGALLARLMAARRKSLQFAPKVGSPLSRTWN